MTTTAVSCLEGLSHQVLALGEHLSDEDWDRPSACPGWSVHDVVIHLMATLYEVVEPEVLAEPVLGDIEASNDRQVEHFRRRGPEQTLADYARLLPAALSALEQMQHPDERDAVVDFDNAGRYPAHLVADSLVFDHYCHLRHDLAEPRGPLGALDAHVSAEALQSSLNWLLAGLPQMSPPILHEALTEPVRLRLCGPAGGAWVLRQDGPFTVTVADDDTSPVGATILSDTDSFLLWGTHRLTPTTVDHPVTIRGCSQLGRRVLDAIHVY
jgi:uncharacterized protein (TIGR03083 family)